MFIGLQSYYDLPKIFWRCFQNQARYLLQTVTETHNFIHQSGSTT